MYINISMGIGIPIISVDEFVECLRNDKLKIEGFRTLKRSNSIAFKEELSKTKYMNSKYGFSNINHIPYIAICKANRNIRLIVRETGLCNISIKGILTNGDIQSTKNQIKNLKNELKSQNIGKMVKRLIIAISKLSDNFAYLDSMRFQANDPVMTIFCDLNNHKNMNIDYFVKLGRKFANTNIKINPPDDPQRMIDTSFNVFISDEFPSHVKRMRRLREKVIQSIQIGHSLQNLYSHWQDIDIKYLQPETLELLFCHNNPKMIRGKKNFHKSIFGKSLGSIWFIEIKKTLELKERLHNLTIHMIREKITKTNHFIDIANIIRQLPSKNLSTKIISPLEIDNDLRLDDEQERIIDILTERIEKEVNQSSSEVIKEYKYGPGLACGRITKNLRGSSSGKNMDEILKKLILLERYHIISSTPYNGPGSKDYSKRYSLNFSRIELRNSLLNLVDNYFDI